MCTAYSKIEYGVLINVGRTFSVSDNLVSVLLVFQNQLCLCLE